jgi:2-dehydro-3-deoxy-D-gluconate 5-dehydrogenase
VLLTGIGAACALALGQAGAALILAIRPGSTDTRTLDTLRAIPNATALTVDCDLSDLDSVRSLFDRALAIAPDGRIDIVVNCAGIQRRAPAVEFSEQDWDDVRTSGWHEPAPFFIFYFTSLIDSSLCIY